MSNISKLIFSVILGIIEGITEFLPISSTGHIILIKNVLSCTYDSMPIFIVIIQLGAILAVLIIFKNQFYNISVQYISNIYNKQYNAKNCLCIQHILIGTAPGVVVGILFYEKIKLLFFNPIYIVYGLVLGNILLLISEWYVSVVSLRYISDINNITYFQAFIIGCFQCLAFWPGFSRLGSTIGGGLLVGLTRRVALEFSFFLAIPIILGSTIFTIYRQKFDIDYINIIIIIIGCASAFIVALVTMQFFIKIVQNISLIPFVMYRCLLAIIIYYWINDRSILFYLYFL